MSLNSFFAKFKSHECTVNVDNSVVIKCSIISISVYVWSLFIPVKSYETKKFYETVIIK